MYVCKAIHLTLIRSSVRCRHCRPQTKLNLIETLTAFTILLKAGTISNYCSSLFISLFPESVVCKLCLTLKSLFCKQKDLTQENAGSSPTGVNKSDLSCIILGDFIEGKTDVNLECMICNKIFNSIIQAGQHYNGQSHKRKLQSVIASNMMSASSLHDVCISSTQQQNASSTTNQLPEGESLLLKADGNNSEVPLLSTNKGMNELYCEFCGLEANSKLQMEMHLRGAKHKNAVTRSAMSTACGGSEKAVFSCVDCHMNFNSQCQLEQHSASQKHQNRVNQQQRYQTVGQCRGRRRMPMSHGRGQQRGIQASSGGFSNRGRGRPLAMYPAISTSFVPSRNIQAYPFNPPSQPTNYSENFTAVNPGF